MVNPLLIGLGTVVVRNLTGWVKNSLADGELQEYEIRELLISTLSVGTLFVVSYYGFGLDEFVSAGAAYIGDMLYSQLKRLVHK